MNGAGGLAVIVVLAGLARLRRQGESFRERVVLLPGIPQSLTFDARVFVAGLPV
jgi:hypothetical protein